MIALGLSPRDRRTLIVGASAVGFIFALGKGVPVVRAGEVASVSAAAGTRDLVAVAEGGSRSVREVRDSATARQRRLDTFRSAMINGASPDAATGSLATLMEKLANSAGVEVLTVTLRPDTVMRFGLVRVAARLSAEGDVSGLMGLLVGIETHWMPLAVRELAVSQTDPAAPSTQMERLRFELVVQTLARVGSAPIATPGKGR
jgi:hypothetical protein